MKTNEFKNVLRQLVVEEIQKERKLMLEMVKKEVSNQLPKLLFEMVRQSSKTVNKPIVNEDIATDPGASTSPVKYQNLIPETQQKKPLKKYVKDPVLNAILNETTPGLPQTPYADTGVPIPNFEKVGVSEKFMDEMTQILNENEDPQQPPEEPVVNTTPASTNLNNLFNKNFKAILNKSKQGHGGNFSNIIQSW